MQTMVLESIPPLRNAPSGTSLTSRRRTASFKRFVEGCGELPLSAGAGARGEPQSPVAGDGRLAALEGQYVPGWQLADALENRQRRRNVLERQKAVERFPVDRPPKSAVSQHRLQFRAEDEALVVQKIEERLHAQPIAGEQQPTVPAVPKGEGEHAVEPVDTGRTVLLIGVDDDFCIRVGGELVALCLQLLPQLTVVVDLTVENNRDATVLAPDRLMASDEIDNAEPPYAETHGTIEEEPFVVGSPVHDRVAHRLEFQGVDQPIPVVKHDARDPAHLDLGVCDARPGVGTPLCARPRNRPDRAIPPSVRGRSPGGHI